MSSVTPVILLGFAAWACAKPGTKLERKERKDVVSATQNQRVGALSLLNLWMLPERQAAFDGHKN